MPNTKQTNIAQFTFIRKNADRLTVRDMADKLNLTMLQAERIMDNIKNNYSDADTRFSISNFKAAVKKIEGKAKKAPRLSRPRPDYIIIDEQDNEIRITRPAATYSNTDWNTYTENLLK